MKMKKASSPHPPYTNPTKQVSYPQHELNKRPSKNRSVLSYVKTAFKRVVGSFTILLPRKSKADGIVNDAAKSNKQVGGRSFSTDLSTGSKSSSIFKSSSTCGSSSATSGMVGEGGFSIQEIFKMTDNFSPANKIGDGSFSTVYKGRLRDGSFVAVKRAQKNTYDKRLLLEFQNEAITLSKIEHLNLVRFYGYVEQGDERILVVEYVGNGNLREHLDGKKGSILEIAERLDIAIDVSHAVTYLHTYTDPPIIHRDIKASNVLITEKLRAKVADFGFARLTTEGSDATHISTQVKGTTGYLDPEYLRTYQLTEKSDVYSFGVLLVELMTGRHPIEEKRSLKERVTIKWVSIGASPDISSLDMTNYELTPGYLCTHCKHSVTKNLGMVAFAVRAIKVSFILSVEGT
ncbi:hypothetical protein NC653_022741 [Populus alba x Populus x berolinensis]|uniref:Protein kinase domain-containing protein n=1 Tax=Populus alba x Populus x berolinensis TaxID=444605 RepID=A0AAD6MG42_9ROSI|nr:hypothetical protein NC653_022741 [Populus alba x Populus x berolinensis]